MDKINFPPKGKRQKKVNISSVLFNYDSIYMSVNGEVLKASPPKKAHCLVINDLFLNRKTVTDSVTEL